MHVVEDIIVVGALIHWATHIFAVVGLVNTVRMLIKRSRRGTVSGREAGSVNV